MTLMEALRQHQQICDELHELSLEENRFLQQNHRAPAPTLLERKRGLLERLDSALAALRGADPGMPGLRRRAAPWTKPDRASSRYSSSTRKMSSSWSASASARERPVPLRPPIRACFRSIRAFDPRRRAYHSPLRGLNAESSSGRLFSIDTMVSTDLPDGSVWVVTNGFSTPSTLRKSE